MVAGVATTGTATVAVAGGAKTTGVFFTSTGTSGVVVGGEVVVGGDVVGGGEVVGGVWAQAESCMVVVAD